MSLYLCPSVCLSLCLSPSLCVCDCLSVLSLSVPLSLSLFVCLSLCLCLCLSIPVSLSPHPYEWHLASPSCLVTGQMSPAPPWYGRGCRVTKRDPLLRGRGGGRAAEGSVSPHRAQRDLRHRDKLGDSESQHGVSCVNVCRGSSSISARGSRGGVAGDIVTFPSPEETARVSPISAPFSGSSPSHTLGFGSECSSQAAPRSREETSRSVSAGLAKNKLITN
jgi:hypothetical protein